jgi:hypothetical protein
MYKFYYNSSQDKIGFIPHNTGDIPVSPQFQIPSSCQRNMSPYELELMLFINENFLSLSIFNKVMKWAHSATANGYKFDSPSYTKLKKQMKYTFPKTINGGGLKSKVFLPEEVGSDLPVTISYFEPLELFATSLQDPQVMKDFVCFLQRKHTNYGSHVYNKITSADWFYEAFNNSPATKSGMLQPGYMCFQLRPNVKHIIVVYIGTEAGNEHYSHIVIDILKGTCEIIMDPHADAHMDCIYLRYATVQALVLQILYNTCTYTLICI